MTKKVLSVILAVLLIIGIVPLATAETERNFTVKTEFYGYDETADDWLPVTTASGGEKLKMRVFVSTNYVSGSSTLLLAYDKSVISADLPSNGSSKQLVTNPEETSFAYNYVQRVNGAHGTGAANNQLGNGNITQEQFDKYGFIVCMIVVNGCAQYDGSEWLLEVDMTVAKGNKGKSFDCFIIPGTVQSITNKKGIVNFPYAPEGTTDISTLSSAFNWYEGTPVVQSGKINVIANTLVPEFYTATFDANGGLFADGSDLAVKSVESYTEITAPQSPEKQGYIFAGWADSESGKVLESLGIMGEENKAFYAQWIPATDTVYTVETYTMSPDGRYVLTTTAFKGTTDETVAVEVSNAEGFELNRELSFTEGVVAADGSLVLKAYYDRKIYKLTTVVDGDDTTAEYYYGAAVTAPEPPEKYGYVFEGWDGEVPETMPANDVVLTAQWAAENCTASFFANSGLFADGNESKSADYDFDTDIIFSETPEKQGYVFAGWAESENGEVLGNLGIMDSTEGKNFYAQWIAADDVAYNVETYTMKTDGTYDLVKTAHEGTTGETVAVEVSDAEGFELNREQSVTEGVIAADGSLVLKVYYDRKIYKLTTVVNGVETATEYRYGAEVSAPASPSVQGYAFKGWDGEVPSAMPANDVTLTAKFSVAATVKIKNNPGSKTINYGEILRLTAETANMPVGAYVKWYVDGSGVSMSQNAEKSTCEITSTGNGTVTVTAKVVDKNGNPLSNESGEISASQKVTSKAGIWQKIVSFFKNLFGANRTIIQMFRIFG